MFLVQKWPFFQLFFCRQYRPKKCLLRYSRTEKGLSKLQKQPVQTVEKIYIFPWFWSKNGQFCQLFCLVNMGQENVFTIF